MTRICPQCRKETDAETCPDDGYRTVDASLFDPADDLIGTTFQGRYRVESKLGSGGMGAVYRAVQLSVDRLVALKVIHSQLAGNLSDVARFQQEARAIASLHHPNIISLIDFGQADSGELFLVMEYLEGMSLGQIIREQAPLPGPRVVKITSQILEALHQAHSRDIVHRDVKPENIFITTMGRNTDFVKVLDFGIAKVQGESDAPLATITQTGTIVGSPRYMAPEQARGHGISGQTDLYAVGAMMYEMLTGRPVFFATSATDCVIKHVTQVPPRPVVEGHYLGGSLVRLVLALLEKDPRARPPGADAALQLLEAMDDDCLVLAGAVTQDDLDREEYDEALENVSDHRSPGEMPATMTVGQWRGALDPTAPQEHSPVDIDTRRALRSTELGVVNQPGGGVEEREAKASAPSAPAPVGRNWMIAAAVLVLGVGASVAAVVVGGDTGPTGPATTALKGGGSLVEATQEDVSRVTIEPKTEMPDASNANLAVESVAAQDPTASDATSTDQSKARPAVPPPVLTTRELISMPSNAAVYRESKVIGRTPFVARWPKDGEPPTLKLVRRGFHPETVTMEPSSEGISQKVQLRPLRRSNKAPGKWGKPRRTPAKYKMID